jgi:hypothetical protein
MSVKASSNPFSCTPAVVSGIRTVTGSTVDNTDPANPVVNAASEEYANMQAENALTSANAYTDLKLSAVKRTEVINLGFATTSLAASPLWYVSTREGSSLTQLVMVTESTYNNTSRTLGEGRSAGYVIPFNCRIKSIRWASGTIATPITINVHSWVASSSATSSNVTVGSKTITSTTGGQNFDFTGSEIDTVSMIPKGARISAFLFNNNVATGTLRFNLLVIEIEEVI